MTTVRPSSPSLRVINSPRQILPNGDSDIVARHGERDATRRLVVLQAAEAFDGNEALTGLDRLRRIIGTK